MPDTTKDKTGNKTRKAPVFLELTGIRVHSRYNMQIKINCEKNNGYEEKQAKSEAEAEGEAMLYRYCSPGLEALGPSPEFPQHRLVPLWTVNATLCGAPTTMKTSSNLKLALPPPST